MMGELEKVGRGSAAIEDIGVESRVNEQSGYKNGYGTV